LLGTDVLVVAAGNTTGWQTAASELVRSIAAAGARVEIVTADRSAPVRTFALTDFVEARAARRAALRGIAKHDPVAIIYCSITAALLWPRPGAIWLDAVAAENRPGRHGIWQRAVERRRLDQTPIVLTMSPGALGPLTAAEPPVGVPVPVDPSGAPAPSRDIAAITYAGDPEKKRIDHVLHAWDQARRDGETLVVAGLDRLEPRPGVEVAGRLDPAEYRALLRRARVFVAAPRREDYGIAPLEALADGCQLVTTPAPGAYSALEIAGRLDARLVDADIARAVRIALDDPSPGYAERAAELLEPFSRRAVDRTVAERVLPRLLPA
jgi:glycosyltransferase involved in cell wall biosynthesis